MGKDAGIATDPLRRATARGRDWLLGLFGYLSVWAETCASYYAASAIYQDLARLSDAELKRRGLSREMLARDVAEAAGRNKRGGLRRRPWI